MQTSRTAAAGKIAVLALRYVFGGTFLYGALHKTRNGWMTTTILREHFTARLAEIPADSFAARYLRAFAIPFYRPIGIVLTLGQIVVAVSTLLGIRVRAGSALGLFLLLNITAGSYFNPSMPPYLFTAVLLMSTPSEQWFGMEVWRRWWLQRQSQGTGTRN
jgi:thiosulfate dehydrogenase (quinone) large subunit